MGVKIIGDRHFTTSPDFLPNPYQDGVESEYFNNLLGNIVGGDDQVYNE